MLFLCFNNFNKEPELSKRKSIFEPVMFVSFGIALYAAGLVIYTMGKIIKYCQNVGKILKIIDK